MTHQKRSIYCSLLAFLLIITPIYDTSARSTKPIYQIITEIQDNLMSKNWDTADQYTQKLDRYYRKHLWKYQLMGDEAEYESATNDISQLRTAIAVKDNKQAMLILSTLKKTLQHIYSL